jgi:hypothetical protein
MAYQAVLRANGVPQVAECLPCKREAQSSNPSTTKKRKKEDTKRVLKWDGGQGML